MDTLHEQAGRDILASRAELAQAVVGREFSLHPELEQRYGKIAREKSLQDVAYHLSYLAQAVAAESAALFCDYVAWARVMLAKRGVLSSDLAFHLGCLREVLDKMPGGSGALAGQFVGAALEKLPEMPDDLPTFLDESLPLSPLAHQYLQSLLRGERDVAARLVLLAVDGGMPVKDIYLHVFQLAQYEIGRLWQTNQISVAQEHYCTAATQLIMSQLYPYIFSGEKNGGTIVAACVSGELHEIGVRMVADFFEMEGWNSYYLGANMPVSGILQALAEHKAEVLGIGTTITYHVAEAEKLIRAVRSDPACRGVKILVGGYPFNVEPDLAKKIGADGSAANAQSAIALANELTGKIPP
jgi:methanogenic corrinoid protein MtbC1